MTVVVVAIVVILLSTGGATGKKVAAPTIPEAQSKVAEVTSLLAGTVQNGNVLGSPTAPVTMQYFGDLECPICAKFTLGALPGIITKWVKTGKLKIEYRSFSTATGNAEKGGSEPGRDVQQTADRGAGSGQAEQSLGLHRALLPRAGRRGQRLRHRKLPSGPGPAGARPEPHEMDSRPWR